MKWILSLLFILPIAAHADCSKFDGLWQGYCSNDRGQRNLVRWDIEQKGCESLKIDRLDFVFGEPTSYRDSDPYWSYRVEDTFTLDKEETRYLNLFRKISGYHRSRPDYMRGDGSGFLEKVDEERIYFYLKMRYEYESNPGRFYYIRSQCRMDRID